MMWQVLTLSVLAAITVVQCDHHFCPSGYSRGQYLDASTQKYLLCWKVDWSDRSITFSAKVATTGWIGLGFSPTGFMPNSDVVIGWVKDGQGYLKVESSCLYYNCLDLWLQHLCDCFTGSFCNCESTTADWRNPKRQTAVFQWSRRNDNAGIQTKSRRLRAERQKHRGHDTNIFTILRINREWSVTRFNYSIG